MRRYSLRVRLLALMIALTVLPVLVLTLVATRNTRASVEREIIGANRTRVDWAAQYVEELLEGLDGLFYSLQLDPEFDRLLAVLESHGIESSDTAGDAAAAAAAGARRQIAQILSGAYYANSRLVDDLALYVAATGEELLVDNVTSGRITSSEPIREPWRDLSREPVALRLVAVGEAIYAVHTINRFEDQSLRGAFAARVDDEFAHRVHEILAAGPSDQVLLLNDREEPVISSTPEAPPALVSVVAELPAVTSTAVVWHGEETIGFGRRIDRGRLAVAKTVPLEGVTRSARDTMTVGILTGAVLAAASLLLSVVFSLRISRPIVELAKSMQDASLPDFNRLTVQSHDEVRLLSDGYHALLARMKALAQREYEQEIELKDARLQALQAQINPHFLNNTLNLLGGMALAKGATEVYGLARAVGDMFRYAVGSDGDLVSLEQELAHVRNYLLIQQNRFSGRCEVSVEVEPAVLSTRIPRFTLQPLVENAFEHGLQKKTGSWHVSVRCAARRLGTMVAVEDNGAGMSFQSLQNLRRRLGAPAPASRSTSIGLRNVDTRLRLHFGEQTRVRVRSAEGSGTIVLFVLPSSSTALRRGDQ